MDDKVIEAKIQEAGLTAPRVTHESINSLMKRVLFSSPQVSGTSTFVHAFLDGKFFLASGHSACVSPENFNAQIGADLALAQAHSKAKARLWELEGYALYKELNRG